MIQGLGCCLAGFGSPVHSQVLLQALWETWADICPVPASFHGWSTALVTPAVSSVVQVAEFGADLH